MVSELNTGLSGPGSSPGQRHCVVFLGKNILHPLLTNAQEKINFSEFFYAFVSHFPRRLKKRQTG